MGKENIKKGEIYGKLEILKDLGMKRVGVMGSYGGCGCLHMYECKCTECGKVLKLDSRIIRRGYSKKCKCKPPQEDSQLKPLQIYGHIKVYGMKYIDNDGNRIYNCQCTRCFNMFMASEKNILEDNVVCECNRDPKGVRMGERYGRLFVLHTDPNDPESHFCRCIKCRFEASVKDKDILKKGRLYSCKCKKYSDPDKQELKAHDHVIGEVHGFLKIIQYSDEQTFWMGSSYWDCLCLNCGNMIYGIRLCDLRLGHRQSCGCLDGINFDFARPKYEWQYVINSYDYKTMKKLKVRPMVPIITDKETGYDLFAPDQFEPTTKQVIYG